MNRFIKSVLVAGALLAAPALAQPVLEPSQTVPYSGVLDLDGAPYEGPVDLRFSIHDALEEGACVWDEVHTAVPVSTGRFGVALGTVALEEAAPAEGCPDPRPLHAALLEPDARYLSVEVRVPGEGAEWLTLSGRQMIGAAPFAMRGVQEGDFIVDGDEDGFDE